MDSEQFEIIISDAINSLPEKVRKNIKNVGFVIESEARYSGIRERGVKYQGELLGLYEGVPLTRRGINYGSVLPDKISIFQKTIEKIAGHDDEKVRKLIYEVVFHEIAHYFGMNEMQVRQWERKRKHKE